MSAHRGVGTELGEVQQGPIGTDAVGDRLGQLDHWGPLVLALGDIQDGGTSLPDRSVGDAPPSGPPKRALGLRRGLRGLRLVRSVAEAAVLVSDPALFAGTTLQPGDGQGGGIHRGRVLVLDRRCREQEQASVASFEVALFCDVCGRGGSLLSAELGKMVVTKGTIRQTLRKEPPVLIMQDALPLFKSF